MITQQEFCDHIEDDFFLRYGNPVSIHCDNGNIILCMAAEYYEQITGEIIKISGNYSAPTPKA